MDTYLIIVRGLQGSGKSTVARYISNNYKFNLIQSDYLRVLHIENPTYSSLEREKIYSLMFEKVLTFLKLNKSVVVDATFYKKKYVDQYIGISAKYNIHLRIIEVQVNNTEIVKKRLDNRQNDYSKATFDIRTKQIDFFEEINHPLILIHNDGSIEDLQKNVLKVLFINPINPKL